MRFDHGRNFPSGILLYLIGVFTLSFTGCVNKAQQSFERPPAPVTVAAAVTQDVPTYLDAIGKTVAREVVSIQPQVSGRIMKIHFTDGGNVKKGDMLYRLEQPPFQADVEAKQAASTATG